MFKKIILSSFIFLGAFGMFAAPALASRIPGSITMSSPSGAKSCLKYFSVYNDQGGFIGYIYGGQTSGPC